MYVILKAIIIGMIIKYIRIMHMTNISQASFPDPRGLNTGIIFNNLSKNDITLCYVVFLL